MNINSTSITDGFFRDEFGKHGTEFIDGKMPSRSFQLSWDDVPAGAKSLALIFEDEDAIPPCGFVWIHWVVVNIDISLGELPENASIDMDLIEARNSWCSGLVPEEFRLSNEKSTAYGGCAPPDAVHQYTIALYALDCELDLQHGFSKNELIWAMQDHILDVADLYAKYRN